MEVVLLLFAFRVGFRRLRSVPLPPADVTLGRREPGERLVDVERFAVRYAVADAQPVRVRWRPAVVLGLLAQYPIDLDRGEEGDRLGQIAKSDTEKNGVKNGRIMSKTLKHKNNNSFNDSLFFVAK